MKKNEILVVLSILPLVVPSSSFAGGESCQPTCDTYKNAMGGFPKPGDPAPTKMSKAYLMNQRCGVPLDADLIGTATTVEFSARSTDADWNACFLKAQSEWAVLGPHCMAISLEGDAQTATRVAAIVYTVAAIACGAACAAEATVVAGPELKGLCIGAGIAAAAADITAEMVVSKSGEGAMAIMGSLSGVAGAGAMTVGTLGLSAVKESAEAAGKSAGDQAAGKIASSCGAMVLIGTAATLKWLNVGGIGDLADQECATIQAMGGQGGIDLNSKTPGNGPQVTGGTIGGPAGTAGGGATGRGGSTGGAGGAYSPFTAAANDLLSGTKTSAATAGPFGALFQALPKGKLLDALQQGAGVGLADVAKRLAAESPMSMMAGMAGASAGFANAAHDLEKEIKDGKVGLKNDPSMAVSSFGGGGGKGGAAKPGGAPSPFGNLFGMKTTGGVGTSSEATFEKMKRDLVPEANGDIWHEGFGGTIFQIVSGTLKKNHDRVEQLEWDTPLNRALTGLPSKKAKK